MHPQKGCCLGPQLAQHVNHSRYNPGITATTHKPTYKAAALSIACIHNTIPARPELICSSPVLRVPRTELAESQEFRVRSTAPTRQF